MKNEDYKILGIDPGTNVTGYAVIQISNNKIKVIEANIIKLGSFENHQTKLKEIFLQIQEVIETYLPSEMSIEAPFFGKNVQSMLKLGRAQGVAMAAAMTMGLKIHEYSPKKIKLAITGNGNATKEQVKAMLEYRFKFKVSNKFLDSTDALAAAVCHFENKNNLLQGMTQYSNWESYIKNNPNKIL